MDKENLNGVPEEETEVPAEENACNDAADETTEELTEEIAEETAEETEDSQEEEEPVLCAVCGEKEAAEGSEYCVECETKMLKRKIPFSGWLSGFIALGFSLFAFLIAIFSLVPSGYVILGDNYAKEDNWHMAYEIYVDIPQEASTFNGYVNELFGTDFNCIMVGEKVNERIMESVSKYYSPIDAYYFAQNFFGTAVFEQPFMEKYEKAYSENYNAFMSMSSIFNSALNGETDAQEALGELEALRGTEGIGDVYVDYYKFALAYELEEPVEAQLEILKKLEASAEASGEDYGWIYYLPMAQALYDTGKYDEAVKYLDKITDENKSSYDAYELKMKAQLATGDTEGAGKTVEEFKAGSAYSELAYFSNLLEIQYLRLTGKYDEMKALCVEASALHEGVPSTNNMINLIYLLESALLTTSEFNRQSALVDIVQGDYASAFDSMMEAYQQESYYAYYMQNSAVLNDPKFYNTLYLSAKLLSTSNMMTEEKAADVEYVLSMFEAGTMSDATEAIISGKKTAEEVLTKGAFDLA